MYSVGSGDRDKDRGGDDDEDEDEDADADKEKEKQKAHAQTRGEEVSYHIIYIYDVVIPCLVLFVPCAALYRGSCDTTR